MKRSLLILIVLFLSVTFVTAQTSKAGTLIMVRCDDGKDVVSPSRVKISHLQSAFDASKDTVIFVHGFMTNYDDAKDSAGESYKRLVGKLGNINYVGFHWPTKWMLFSTAIDNATKAGACLVHVASKISGWYGGNGGRIHIVTHSLGGRVTLIALQSNEARYVKWGNCFHMAPAVHNDSFTAAFNGTNNVPRGSYIYYSHRDGVLKYLYSLYYMFFGKNTPRNEAWEKMTVEAQVEYLKKLDTGRIAKLSTFDLYLIDVMDRASKKAMGLAGSLSAGKVYNVDMGSAISAHTKYWGSNTVMSHIASKAK